MDKSEADRATKIRAICEGMGGDKVRGELRAPHDFHLTELSVAAAWLYEIDRKRNEKFLRETELSRQEDSAINRRNVGIAMIAAIFSGMAAVATLVIAFVSCHAIK